jgi:two-component system, NtrC family, response regulator
MKPKLLIVDDDEDLRGQMRWALSGEYDVSLAQDRESALEAFSRESPPVVVLDLGLPPRPADPTEGMAVLAELQTRNDLVKVLVATGQGEKENAIRAIGEGAFDFLCKPVEMEELTVILKRAFHVAALERAYRELRQQWDGEGFEGMIGSSPVMQDLFHAIRKVATAEAPVLILGESGTGKEMAALAIHRRSRRKEGPFVPINCGAIPENLLESELFGHEKGSFTGAHAQRPGRIEAATDGTLFLDEIGELPLQLQVKLLRFLQEGQIERVGGRKPIRVNARVVAATNSDLATAMRENKFREDLYYRLAVVVLKLPPLRERGGDTNLLAESFLRRFAAESGRKRLRFDKGALQAMAAYPWPGNVRELFNRIKRSVIMSEGGMVGAGDLELAATPDPGAPKTLKEARDVVDRTMIVQAMRTHDGNISKMAAELGISRPTLYELMERLGIRKE